MTYTSTRFLARSLLALVLPAVALGASAGSTPASRPTTAAAAVEPDTRHESKSDKNIAIIDAFLASPTTTATAPIILMVQDADVVVEINNEAVPVLGLKAKKAGTVLLIAFIAGNMREQLINGTRADDALSGVRAMLKVYAILKTEGVLDAEPILEKMQQREIDGSLEQFVNAN